MSISFQFSVDTLIYTVALDQTQHSLDSLRGLKSKHEEYNSHAGLTWIFHFVDIIYVGAVSSIGRLFELCGTDYQVFLLAASYTGIMFTTRYQFDQYASTFNTHKTENNKEFTRIILMILYCMAIFSMALNIAYNKTEDDYEGSTKGHFGSCFRGKAYDNGFAASFLISRAAIIFLYIVKQSHEKYRHNADYRKLFLRKIVPMIVASALMIMVFFDISPVKVFTIVAVVEFVGEFVGEWAVNLKPSDFAPLMPDPEHLQERLGLFFMLILGETMVGILRLFYEPSLPRRTYGTCLAAFVLVTAVGMQFFERAQSDVDSPSNEYGDVYDENEDLTRLSSYVAEEAPPKSSATTSALHSNTSSSALSGAEHVSSSTIGMDSFQVEVSSHRQRSSNMGYGVEDSKKWNHHPLLHKNKFFYASYVALHAIISFFMLIATTAVVEIYYHIEEPDVGVNCEAPEDDHVVNEHYKLLKSQCIWGLVGVWCCMLLMEMLQPEYYNSLVADWRTSRIVDQQYSKFLFAVKVCVIISHLTLFRQSTNPQKGNYFVFYTALIAGTPCFFDISKIVYEYLWDVQRKRKDAALRELERKRLMTAAGSTTM